MDIVELLPVSTAGTLPALRVQPLCPQDELGATE
ncbi:hypothetical protein QF030_004263 [Streptomyces rishiriensis]|uniref:Uncharacterized protein n=1 Tax=Streptomyces rishiriensis TaxID=68264 RepID=A0ABU0NUI8_STRRH|nr:hypothetical protein [Streptomyces rishiriensis]